MLNKDYKESVKNLPIKIVGLLAACLFLTIVFAMSVLNCKADKQNTSATVSRIAKVDEQFLRGHWDSVDDFVDVSLYSQSEKVGLKFDSEEAIVFEVDSGKIHPTASTYNLIDGNGKHCKLTFKDKTELTIEYRGITNTYKKEGVYLADKADTPSGVIGKFKTF